MAATLRGIVLQWVADPARVDLAAAGATALSTLARACASTPDSGRSRTATGVMTAAAREVA